jgi:hypothetical protein
MDDGNPIRFCDDSVKSIESFGYNGSLQHLHAGGVMEFLRHHFRHSYPDDVEHKLTRCDMYSSHDELKKASSSTLSSDGVDGWSVTQTTDSSVPAMGRSLTWASFRGNGLLHERPHANLSAVQEAPDSAAGANQSTMTSSQSYHFLPAVVSFASLPPSNEHRAAEKPSFSIGEKSETDSHSFFGLPSRIKVTKRELNMMTPSSF